MDEFYFICTCVCFTVVGLCIGSFLNVVVYRLPRGMNLATPPSHCPQCDHRLAWYDNIPLLSFLVLRGKCRYCGAKISPRYFIVELTNCVLWLACALTFYQWQNLWYAIVCALALSVLLTMALCDMEDLFIPDSLQIALAVLAVAGIFADGVTPWNEKLIGLVLGGGFFLFFYFASFLLFGREGLGFGDVKLMAAAGLLLGWKGTVCAIVFGIAAALLGIVVRRFACIGRKPLFPVSADEFAFAPYLVFGIAGALVFGNTLMDAYLTFIG